MRSKSASKNDPWRSGTWDGARLEQLRRWRKLPLREQLEAVEAMGELAKRFGKQQKRPKTVRKARP